jgi:riboflavin synthase
VFTGIIEATAKVKRIAFEQGNLQLWVESGLSKELKIDQSLAHNGVCLTVVELGDDWHRVTAVAETLAKTNLGKLVEGNLVNLERCLSVNGRFDGHIVQGHVDTTATCVEVKEADGSWLYYFRLHDTSEQLLIVDKGSICINGVSLTVVACTEEGFYVTIIPYTYEHTTFGELKAGYEVNLEFDILGKYIQKQLAGRG